MLRQHVAHLSPSDAASHAAYDHVSASVDESWRIIDGCVVTGYDWNVGLVVGRGRAALDVDHDQYWGCLRSEPVA